MRSRRWWWRIAERLNLLPKTSFWFGDAQAHSRKFPYTFFAPSQTALDAISVGELVMVWFEYDRKPWHLYSGERMWVKITARDQDEFCGTVENVPLDIVGLAVRDMVEFRSENILSRDVADPEGDPTEKYLPQCLCSKAILDGKPVHYLSRSNPLESKPDQEFPDSGWQFLADGEYASEIGLDGVRTVSLGAVSRRDDRWLHLIDAEPGCQFEWNASKQNFIELVPFDPDADDIP